MEAKRIRKAIGSALLDLPVTLWVLTVILMVPLIDLATVTLRMTFLYAAAHNATTAAARAVSYLTPMSGSPSAVQLADSAASAFASGWGGVTVTSVSTQIITTNIATHAQTIQSTPLSAPADNSINTYQVQVTVVGTVAPLWTFNLPWFGNAPGLSGPASVTIVDRQYFENTSNLNI